MAKKGVWADPQPVPPWECGRGNSLSKEAYFLALARLESAREVLSETRIVGLNKSGSESASRSPNDTHVRMGRRTFWRAITWDYC